MVINTPPSTVNVLNAVRLILICSEKAAAKIKTRWAKLESLPETLREST